MRLSLPDTVSGFTFEVEICWDGAVYGWVLWKYGPGIRRLLLTPDGTQRSSLSSSNAGPSSAQWSLIMAARDAVLKE